ncbi:S1/P1 Nuclease [Mucilaginibacter mallensis]|uniref:S1/P1 Nuclease n=1 Tax=Mucilaginibacter mallensis TaxID=652787 RepID=A0A1H2C5I5_MUCMA|nr:S1/P1 nuclease [Mucilaginibacter mallensis]SDT65507.1 S1/P1 Nuclease [Mucilaginibacter mallensis]
MKNAFLKKLILGIVILYAPVQAMAWGTTGHRICGQIAESYLTPKAREAVHAILGHESIAIASNWADFIKSDPSYSYLSSWHYIDLNKAYTYPELVDFLNQDTNVDAYTKLNFLIGELKKKDISKPNRLLYLHMLIHIIEDVHQPMHVAHADDKGGNDFKVTWFNNPTNLHSVWDSQLIDFQQLSYTEYATAINHTNPAEVTEWQSAPISKWLFESNQIAEILYTDIKPEDNLSYKYNFSHIDTLNRQLLKAGVRLAGILNQIFG